MSQHAMPGHSIKSRRKKEVLFSLDSPNARHVYLAGDFNQWSATSHRMFKRGGRGNWEKAIDLEPGRYEYQFIIDGIPAPDVNAAESVLNANGLRHSVVHVR